MRGNNNYREFPMTLFILGYNVDKKRMVPKNDIGFLVQVNSTWSEAKVTKFSV